MRLIFDTYDELVLHHKVCIFLFSELLTWIKGRLDCIWKAREVNEVDWGPSPSIPNVFPQATTSLLAQGNKESSPTRFGCSIRTAELSQLATVTTASYEIQLGHSSTLWKAYQVYFPIDPTSPSYHLESAAIVVLQQRPFLSTGAATPIFGQWTMYHVACPQVLRHLLIVLSS